MPCLHRMGFRRRRLRRRRKGPCARAPSRPGPERLPGSRNACLRHRRRARPRDRRRSRCALRRVSRLRLRRIDVLGHHPRGHGARSWGSHGRDQHELRVGFPVAAIPDRGRRGPAGDEARHRGRRFYRQQGCERALLVRRPRRGRECHRRRVVRQRQGPAAVLHGSALPVDDSSVRREGRLHASDRFAERTHLRRRDARPDRHAHVGGRRLLGPDAGQPYR